ncbi:hypothetical protein TNCT_467461 [Trichonephila clavata]|uniref:Uncharacterized protein n=1 Tax=Trichonephila clavata TaxID=2740835 RepID=A0A8X6G7K9_TRICU|nr:hypothetical protein TNCT_467461 [Trichonephila clavata]
MTNTSVWKISAGHSRFKGQELSPCPMQHLVLSSAMCSNHFGGLPRLQENNCLHQSLSRCGPLSFEKRVVLELRSVSLCAKLAMGINLSFAYRKGIQNRSLKTDYSVANKS